MKPNRAELALLRGKRDTTSLQLWAHAFGEGDPKKAERLGLAIATFLGQPPPTDAADSGWNDYFGQLSPNTRKAYAYALTEFFEWVAARHKKIVTPDKVTRLDAEQYVTWLTNRPFSLAQEKLSDEGMGELKQLYDIIAKEGEATLATIVAELPSDLKRKYFGDHSTTRAENRRVLSTRVRELILLDVVEAHPTMATLRKTYSQAGLSTWSVPLGPNGAYIALEEVFKYTPKQAKGVGRMTVSQRVSALSSFWKVLAQGENTPGGEPLLQFNVWDMISKRVLRGLSHEKKEASRRQKMPSKNVIKLLRDAPTSSLVQLRNKAMLYLMVFAGARTTEILMLRRGKPERGTWKAWFDGSEPPALQLVRKGNKTMRLPYPPVALKVLIEFQQMLERHAAPTFAQSSDPREEYYVSRESAAWYYRDLQLPDAPLFPPISLWGHQKRVDYHRPLSRVQCFRLLKQLGKDAGLTDEEVKQIHPHALRHFSANAMVQGGKDIREVQAILGHSSMTTTESYLEDPEGDVKLSGQEAILDFLDVQGVRVKPTYTGGAPAAPREREVIDSVAHEVVEVEAVPADPEQPSDLSPEVTPEELRVLESLFEPLPLHEFPAAPPDFDPEVVVQALPHGKAVVVEQKPGGTLIGLDGHVPMEELQEGLAASVIAGQSPGSPAWVYESMADPQGTHETIVFNRGGERDKKWLDEHYPKMPVNFGIGHESYLLWYVKAKGNISRGGYFKGLPPFPVFSPEQCNPETSSGESFLAKLEETYSALVHGNPAEGIAPSPLRSVGIVRWYSFFVYHATKYEAEMAEAKDEDRPLWCAWNEVVSTGEIRTHDEAWLVQWLQDNAHTYRASIDSMKRGVSRTDEDLTATFLKSSFEGIELITDVPEWMIEDDPIHALFKTNPQEWREMIAWLKNVTGQKLEAARSQDRAEQEQTAIEEQKMKARMVRNVLMSVLHLVDQLSRAKHTAREQVEDLRDQLRAQLYWYATVAGKVQKLKVSLDSLQAMGTREFNQAMSAEYKRLEIPNPDAAPYKELKGRKRVSAIVAKLFPDIPELMDPNVFAESKLFDPKWFRIDEAAHTVFIEAAERDNLIRQFGQDPELLVRRATRAMWEARDKGHEALWGILMSTFSWIVPSGREMESKVLGIPIEDLGSKKQNAQARKTWLKAWTEQMKRLAMGKPLEEGGESWVKQETASESSLAPWEKFLLEESRKQGEDALDRIAGDGVDFAMAASVSGRWEDSPEDILMDLEEGGEKYWRNPSKYRLRRNGSESFVHIEGEHPQQWYRVDLFGRRQGSLRPNAPPVLVSPGVVYRSQKRVFAARQLLPSPFRMIAAMGLRE